MTREVCFVVRLKNHCKQSVTTGGFLINRRVLSITVKGHLHGRFCHVGRQERQFQRDLSSSLGSVIKQYYKHTQLLVNKKWRTVLISKNRSVAAINHAEIADCLPARFAAATRSSLVAH